MEKERHQLLALANSHLLNGEKQQALDICQTLNRDDETCTEAWILAASILQSEGHGKRAVILLQQGIQRVGQQLDLLVSLAEALFIDGQSIQALELARALSEQVPDKPYVISNLAMLLTRLEQHEIALALYQKAVRIKPDEIGFYFNLATAQRFCGDLVGAESSLDVVLKHRPQDGEAQSLRSGLRRQTQSRNHLNELRQLLSSGELSHHEQIRCGYALAKELEDLGHYSESFQELQSAADRKRQQMTYSVETDVRIMEEIQTVFSPQLFHQVGRGCDSSEPIFIIGMPRTGTTLLERILGNHSDVHAAGELNNFSREVVKLSQVANGDKTNSRLDVIANSAHLDFNRLGDNYIRSTRPLTGHTKKFIDKLPFNFLYAGLIHLAFPKARIIHVSRNPMDTGYAVYKQLFEEAYPFSYDLNDIAQYFSAYQSLMSHWRKVMPGVMIEVRYEDLVECFEDQARSLLEACGLPWEEQCLNLSDNRAASTTASAAQVRGKVYQSSVGKWRHFEEELRPLAEAFRAQGLSF